MTVKMTTKKIVVLKSFVIVGSFDCDHTQIYYGTLMDENILKCTTHDKQNLVFIVDWPKGAGCRPFPPHVHCSNLYKVDNLEMGD